MTIKVYNQHARWTNKIPNQSCLVDIVSMKLLDLALAWWLWLWVHSGQGYTCSSRRLAAVRVGLVAVRVGLAAVHVD